ncbi:hypothetical protein FH972_023235 [Carpinus fangiana]|uniref:Ras-GEF domain-containing protein n=1 Tax=Carpinus fangiana TaxID=176857 RepID=A0A5N6KUM0_9ROSI|nr:hypothetical protein FH972_023235 [Carpinus fangiana]
MTAPASKTTLPSPASSLHTRALSVNVAARRGLNQSSGVPPSTSRGVKAASSLYNTEALALDYNNHARSRNSANHDTTARSNYTSSSESVADRSRLQHHPSSADHLQSHHTPHSLRTKTSVADLKEEASEQEDLARSTRANKTNAAQTTSSHPHLNFAVLGCSGAGKTTFIRNALSLTPKQHAPSKAKLASVAGQLYSVRLFEFTFDQLPLRRDSQVVWPQRAQGIPLEHVDGAFILYDPTNGSSLDPVAKYLSSVQSTSIPVALLAAKWDLRPAHRRLAPDQIEQSKLLSDRSLALQASSTQPGTAQRCLSALLSATTRTTKPESTAPIRTIRPRRHTANLRPSHLLASVGVGPGSGKHNRATSDLSLISSKSPSVERHTGIRSARNSSQPSRPIRPNVRVDTTNMLSVPGTPEDDSPRSFLDMEDSPAVGSRLSSDSEASSQLNFASPQAPIDSSVFTFEELVTRLLTTPQVDVDVKFQTSFLTLYRLFAAPLELLSAILDHFTTIQDPEAFMTTLGSPTRDLSVIHQWLTSYPGDFARSATQKKLRTFLLSLKEEAEYVVMAKALLNALAAVNADDDTDWARTDDEITRPGTAHTFLSTSSGGSDRESFKDAEDEPSDPSRIRYTPSFTDSSPTLVGPQGSLTSSQTTMVSDGPLQRQANILVPRPTFSFNKSHWRALMQTPDLHIAHELTRMDWVMFSLIRPRDLVRHVTLQPEARRSFPGTDNVNRMIEHFNHVAYFVTNIVLYRDKPKHRTLALEKMMRVGRELRKLNNYNALGAVVAGIRGSAVQRLAQTWDLLSEERRRDFLKLEILMGTNRGHAAYRMAWENSFGERIPFLPLHRRDLIVAEQGNRTFASAGDGDALHATDRRVSWRKFEIMGDVLIGVRDAQRANLTGIVAHDDVRSLVLEGKLVKDEELLYERSVQLEPRSTAVQQTESGIAGIDISSVRRRLNPFLSRYGIV